MKKQMAMLLAVVFLAAICSGCQPTPERPPIVGKGDGKLEQIVASGAPESGTPAPEAENPAPQPQDLGELRWKETYTVSNLICKFDPEIIVPENMIFPVYEARQTAFTLDSVQPLVEYFTQGAQGMREAYPTKEELESQLIHVKRGNYVIQDDYRAWEPYEGQEEDIKALEEQIRSARAEEFTEVQPLTVLPTNMIYKLPNGKRAHIVAKDRSFYFYTYGESAYMQLESLVLDGEAYPGEPEGSRIEPQISGEEAKQAAQELIAALGLSEFAIAEAEKARILELYTCNKLSQGWRVTFTRTNGGSIPVYYENAQPHQLLHFGDTNYVASWRQENITVYVDQNGVQSMNWTYPMEITGVRNENVPLLPFSEIQQRIRDAIKYGYAADPVMQESKTAIEWYIDRMVLTNAMVPIKDDMRHKMLMPVWIVFFREQYAERMTFVCAINAVDGSNIQL